jgi:hypothetical protein
MLLALKLGLALLSSIGQPDCGFISCFGQSNHDTRLL